VIERGNGVEAVCGGMAESTICGVNEKIPGAVGVPLIWPDVVFRRRPGGKLPEIFDHVNGGTPPDATIAVAYAAFSVAPRRAPLDVIDSAGGALILMVY
jgi:hypothetical protein